MSNSLTTYDTYTFDNFIYPIFTVFPWCQRSVVSGRSGIYAYVVKTSTTRATPVVADTVFWTSTQLLDTLYTVSLYHLHTILQDGYHYSGIPMTMSEYNMHRAGVQSANTTCTVVLADWTGIWHSMENGLHSMMILHDDMAECTR